MSDTLIVLLSLISFVLTAIIAFVVFSPTFDLIHTTPNSSSETTDPGKTSKVTTQVPSGSGTKSKNESTTKTAAKDSSVKGTKCENVPESYLATFCCKDCTSVQGGNPHNGSYPNCMADGRIEHNGECCASRDLCMLWPNEHKYYMYEWKKCGYKSEVEKFPNYQCLRGDMT